MAWNPGNAKLFTFSQCICKLNELMHDCMYTRCLNKEWQTWESGIPLVSKPAHLCLEQIPANVWLHFDRHWWNAKSFLYRLLHVCVIEWKYKRYDQVHVVFDSYKEQLIKHITTDKRLLVATATKYKIYDNTDISDITMEKYMSYFSQTFTNDPLTDTQNTEAH